MHQLFDYALVMRLYICYVMQHQLCTSVIDISYCGVAIFFPGLFFIIFSYFCSFLWLFGVCGFWVGLGRGLRMGFESRGFQMMGFGACGVRPSGFFGLGLSI